MKSKKQVKQVADSLRIGNPMHLAACQQGSRIQRNRKKYTRKEKYKTPYEY